jgi:hypothetical protein
MMASNDSGDLASKVGRAITLIQNEKPDDAQDRITILTQVRGQAVEVADLMKREDAASNADERRRLRNERKRTGRSIANQLTQYANQFNVRDINEILGDVYKSPEVGTYAELKGEGPLLDGTVREAHHVPPYQLINSMGTQLQLAGLRVAQTNPRIGLWLQSFGADLRGDDKRDALPAILVHAITHKNAGGDAFHSAGVALEVDSWLTTNTNVDSRITKRDGELSANPRGEAYERYYEDTRFNKKYGSDEPITDVDDRKVLRDVTKATQGVHSDVFVASCRMVETALAQSRVDGDSAGKRAALAKLRGEQRIWRNIFQTNFDRFPSSD